MEQQALKASIAICDGINILLPNSMIADVVSGVNVTAVDAAHYWQTGQLIWQGIRIPVLSFEQIVRGKQARLRGSHIAVIRGTSDTETLPFYGIPTQAAPTEFDARPEMDVVSENIPEDFNQIQAMVRIHSVPCVIPDIANIETQISSDIRSGDQ